VEIEEKNLLKFLKFHLGVIEHTQMPYLRKITALDFCRDNLHFDYAQAEQFLDTLFDQGYVAWDQHGAFPGTILTDKSREKIKELVVKFGNSPDSEESKTTSEPVHKITITWGPTQKLDNRPTAELVITDEMTYKFLKFVDGVSQRSGSPYCRELVAEDFAMDILKLNYEHADRFIHTLMERGFLEESQYGAFPGVQITKDGIKRLNHLRTSFDIQ
jgi:hypothetical protein